VLVKSC